MTREKYYKGLFLVGAIWNWIIATILFFAYEPIFKSLGMRPLQYAFPLQLCMALAFVYGIAFKEHTGPGLEF